MTIEGTIILEPAADLAGALLRVSLEDVTMQDAPSRVLATCERRVQGAAISSLPFELEVKVPITSARQYALRAELLRSSSNALEAGDYLSTIATPWRADSNERYWSVTIRRV